MTRPATTRRAPALAAALLAAAAALAACAGTASEESAAIAAAAGPPAVVPVALTEDAPELPTTTFVAGTYTFEGTVDGVEPHALAVAGPGVAQRRSPEAAPGARTQLTVTLSPGTYELWCPLERHRRAGTVTTLTVTGGAARPGSGY